MMNRPNLAAFWLLVALEIRDEKPARGYRWLMALVWFGDQPVKYGVPTWGVVIYVRGKRLMGLVKIRWLTICLLPLLKLHSVYNFVIHKIYSVCFQLILRTRV